MGLWCPAVHFLQPAGTRGTPALALGTPGFATSSCVCRAALCSHPSPQLDSRTTLGHCAAVELGCLAAPTARMFQYFPRATLKPSYWGKRQQRLRVWSYPRQRTPALLPTGKGCGGAGTLLGSRIPPVTHPSDRARGKWISAVPQLTEILVDAPVRICLTNSHNLSQD